MQYMPKEKLLFNFYSPFGTNQKNMGGGEKMITIMIHNRSKRRGELGNGMVDLGPGTVEHGILRSTMS